MNTVNSDIAYSYTVSVRFQIEPKCPKNVVFIIYLVQGWGTLSCRVWNGTKIPNCILKTLISCFRCVWLGLELNLLGHRPSRINVPHAWSNKTTLIYKVRLKGIDHWKFQILSSSLFSNLYGIYLFCRTHTHTHTNCILTNGYCWLPCLDKQTKQKNTEIQEDPTGESLMFGLTWEWLCDDRISIFGWAISLSPNRVNICVIGNYIKLHCQYRWNIKGIMNGLFIIVLLFSKVSK